MAVTFSISEHIYFISSEPHSRTFIKEFNYPHKISYDISKCVCGCRISLRAPIKSHKVLLTKS
jgi:hypothetical protein